MSALQIIPAIEPEFQAWPKIARLNREVVVTEKIDGTNAAVIVTPEGAVRAQSRKKIITPSTDNFGFATWVYTNADMLADNLGEGIHFGEWYGAGIQRKYGLSEKRFMLFNADRWGEYAADLSGVSDGRIEVATVLDRGNFDTDVINRRVRELRETGSRHVPGFMNPEGVVAYHIQGNVAFKVTCDKDDQPKGVPTA